MHNYMCCIDKYYTMHFTGIFYILYYYNLLLINFLIEQFEDGQTLILCMLNCQAKALQNLKYFQIDLMFKRMHENINEFEINSYDETHKLSKYFNYKFIYLPLPI